jgi:hypothetical protein
MRKGRVITFKTLEVLQLVLAMFFGRWRHFSDHRKRSVTSITGKAPGCSPM